MTNSFKLCPAHFSRGGEKFSRGTSPPGYGAVLRSPAEPRLPALVARAQPLCAHYSQIQSTKEKFDKIMKQVN